MQRLWPSATTKPLPPPHDKAASERWRVDGCRSIDIYVYCVCSRTYAVARPELSSSERSIRTCAMLAERESHATACRISSHSLHSLWSLISLLRYHRRRCRCLFWRNELVSDIRSLTHTQTRQQPHTERQTILVEEFLNKFYLIFLFRVAFVYSCFIRSVASLSLSLVVELSSWTISGIRHSRTWHTHIFVTWYFVFVCVFHCRFLPLSFCPTESVVSVVFDGAAAATIRSLYAWNGCFFLFSLSSNRHRHMCIVAANVVVAAADVWLYWCFSLYMCCFAVVVLPLLKLMFAFDARSHKLLRSHNGRIQVFFLKKLFFFFILFLLLL